MSTMDALWNCREPAAWPLPPEEMTYSTLVAMEACPRRWALQTADYPELWEGRGYPPKIVVKGLMGTIVHSVTEAIAKELVRSGCASINEGRAIQVMRTLGGYTKLVGESIETTVARVKRNPRASKAIDHVELMLRGKISELRGQIQGLLVHVRLDTKWRPRNWGSSGSTSGSLGPGLHAEVTLRSESIGWSGKADLLAVGDAGSEIVEFKTGERREEHVFQISIYSMLWWRDKQANPKGLPTVKLTLAYPDGHVEVPAPTAEEVARLAEELRSRTAKALQDVAQNPPPARPSSENCRFCGVKQKCAEYWAPGIQRSVQVAVGTTGYADAEVLIRSRHGPTSWDATIEASGNIVVGVPILIRVTTSDLEFRAGDRVRLLDLWFSADPEGLKETKVATAGTQCEAYVVRSEAL